MGSVLQDPGYSEHAKGSAIEENRIAGVKGAEWSWGPLGLC
ncbi:MAG: hypothetical protein JWQ43_4057 [Glaciihabitans sp.]|nr:hypothetical protein [Glaciihabitans sp.]